MPHNDYTYVNITCPECKQNKTLRDNHREETFCTHCGLVIQENKLFQVTLSIQEEETKVKFIRSLWRKKK